MRKLLAALALAGAIWCGPAHASCGPQNPNCIVPTAPVGTSNNQAASTQFVQQAITGGSNLPLASGKIYIGSLAGIATAQAITGSGDCTVSLSNAGVMSFVCTKTNNVAFAPSATTDTTNAGNIASGALANARLTPGAANTYKGSLNGSATSDIALVACTAVYQVTQYILGAGWQCTNTAVLPSRTIAATLNLSAFSSVETLGYATPGDGGQATYVKLAAGTAFLDTYPTSFTLTNAGTGCTPGTYSNTLLVYSDPVSLGTWARVTVGGGGTVTSSTVSTPGTGFNVGDTAAFLSGEITGCSVQPSFTVASVSTPTGSFIDAAGNHWQIQLRPDNSINVLAFGAKADWSPTCTDSCATNNTSFIQSAFWFAYGQGQQTVSGFNGNLGARVDFPPKTMMSCALVLPQGVTMAGAGRYSSTLKDCDSEPSASNFITVGDATLQLSCFGSYIRDIALTPGAQTNTPSAGTAMIFSNCIQQQTFLERVWPSGAARSCISLQTGFGGAEGVGMHDIECNTSVGTGININYGSAIIDMNHIVVETGAAITANAIAIAQGTVDLRNFHTEGYSTGIFLNVAANNGISSFHHLLGGSSCTNLVLRQSGSAASVNIIGMAEPNGCTNTLNNAGTATTGNIIADAVF